MTAVDKWNAIPPGTRRIFARMLTRSAVESTDSWIIEMTAAAFAALDSIVIKKRVTGRAKARGK